MAVSGDVGTQGEGFNHSIIVGTEDIDRDVVYLGGVTNTTNPVQSHFFNKVEEYFSDFPASRNPDLQPGISLHFDVGVSNPFPSDDRWGDWGGGNDCFDYDIDPVAGWVLCDYKDAAFGTNAADCGTSVAGFEESRRWLFHWFVDSIALGSGGQYDRSLGVFGASTTMAFVHEFGHSLQLEHEGPRWSAPASVPNSANYNSLFVSRMNYLYDDTGPVDLTASTSLDVRYSRGDSYYQHSVRETPELVSDLPFANLSVIDEFDPADRYYNITTGTWDFDFSNDGSISAMGHQHAARKQNARRQARSRFEPTDAFGVAHSLVVAGDGLAHLFVEDGQVMARFDGPDQDCPVLPAAGYLDVGSGWVPPSYGDCIEFGTAVSLGVAADSVVAASDGTRIVLMFLSGNDLHWGELSLSTPPGSTATEMNYSFVDRGTLYSGIVAGEPAIVAHPAGGFLMMFRVVEPQGYLYQFYLPSGSTTWAPGAVWVGPLGGSQRLLYPDSVKSPGLVVRDGSVYLFTDEVGVGFPLLVYAQYGSGAPESRRWQETSEFGTTNALFQGRSFSHVHAVTTPPITGDVETELHVLGREESVFGEVAYNRTREGTWDLFSGVTYAPAGYDQPAAVYDGRASTPDGMRVIVSWDGACATDQDCEAFEGDTDDLVCDTSTSVCRDSGGRRTSWYQVRPFGSGNDPTEHCDVDEWLGVDWGSCAGLLVNRQAPAPYDGVRCRNHPVYPLPDALGSCERTATLSPVDEDFQALFPDAYDVGANGEGCFE